MAKLRLEREAIPRGIPAGGPPDWAEVETRLRKATDRVVAEDRHLLEQAAHEQAISHRLATYLGDEFPGWVIDCEYNRVGTGRQPKHIQMRDGTWKPVRPDIIVHQRGDQPWGYNFLAIEVKPAAAAREDIDDDKYKLTRYLVDHRYDYAVFVSYRTSEPFVFALERIE